MNKKGNESMSTKVKVKSRPLPQDLERWNDEEIARFFEENDPLEFLDETESVEVDASRSTMTQVHFRLPQNALIAIKQLARRLGLGTRR